MFRLMVQALHYISDHICLGLITVIGVKPADEYQFRVFTTPVVPYFKGGAKPTRSVYLILTGQLLTERGILRRGLIMQ